jgi:hypothetical protein
MSTLFNNHNSKKGSSYLFTRLKYYYKIFQMQLSYWELKMVYKVDYTVVGSGIVGLHAALRLREYRKVKY